MNPSMTFNLAGGPGIRVTVVQMPDGTLQITASLISTAIVGDLRGLFFQVSNENLLGGLSVTASTSGVTRFAQNANAVSNLGSGVNTLGAARASDVGIAFGTASASGADDIRSVTFTLAHATEALTLDFLSQMQFAAVIGSVGPAGGPRSATVRAVGSAPANAPPLAQDDTATVAEGGSVTIDVLANDTDPTNDALTIAGFTQPAKGSVTLADGKLVFDASAGFESLGDGDSEIQTFTYTVSDGRGGMTTATVAVTVTGVTPPAPTIAFATPDAGATPENGGALVFILTRTGDLSAASTADLRLSSTADGDDIFGITGAVQLADPTLWRVSFAPGEASATVEVLIAPDSVPEPDETVTFTIAAATGAVLSPTGPLVATGTISNDDFPPALAFRSLDLGSSTEGTAGFSPQGRLVVALDRSGDLSFATSVVFELGGTASLDDIASVSATNGGSATPFPFVAARYILTFDPGAASAEIELFLTPDTGIEADETVTITLVSATGGVLPPEGQRTATGTILDDDAVSVGFAEADAGSVNEGGPGPDGRLAFTLQRSGSLALDTVVRFVVQGEVAADEIDLLGATRIGDGPPGSAGLFEATIAAGASETVIEVFARGDRIPEADETVTLDLVEVVANGALAGITSASGVFLNDDVPPAVAFRALDAGATLEGTAGTTPQGVLFFVLERSGDLSYATTVTFEVGGTASPDDIAFLAATNGGSLAPVPGAPGRYTLTFDAGAASADIEVYITPDAAEEAPETVTLTLLSAFDGRLPDPAERTATGIILDDDAPPPPPALALREADAGSAPEGTLGVAPPGRLVFAVTRTGDLSVPTTVTFDLGGTASADDYWVSSVAAGGSVAPVPLVPGRYILTFDAGAAEAEIELLMVPDAAIEPDETVTLTLVSATGGTLPPADERTATGTILDDDTPPPNTPPVANDVSFAIDEDTPFIANMFGFTSDAELNQESIAILGTTNLTVTNFDGATGAIEVQPLPNFFGIATITYRVTDAGGLSDTGVVTLTVVPVDDPPVGVPDTATTAPGEMVVIDVLANDFDVEGEDLYAIYTFTLPQNGFVIFFPGLAGGPVHYTPDPGFVGTDSFTYTPFTIGPDGTAVPGNETLVTVTVAPPAPFAITQTGERARPEGNPDTPIGFVFEVTRSGAHLPAATLTYALGPGPGISADSADLVFGFGTFTIDFAAGQTSSGIISIPVTADLVAEPDETFTLSLVGATAGDVDTTPIVFTILDDDGVPPPPPPSGARFYFSGSTPGAGRELWFYDTNSDPSTPFATMVEGAEWLAGPQSSTPREIMGLSGTVFFRADEDGTPTWLAWTGSTLIALGAVDTEAFDAGLPLAERNLGVLSGDLAWLAIEGELRAFDAEGQQVAAVPLEGTENRRLLTDGGGKPVFAAETPLSDNGDVLVPVLDAYGWTYTSAGSFSSPNINVIREIAGFRDTPEGVLLNVSDPAKRVLDAAAFFFSGDHNGHPSLGFVTDALFRQDLWFAEVTRSFGPGIDPLIDIVLYLPSASFVDINGTDGAVPLAPFALTVAPVTDGAGGSRDTLFLFGNDNQGLGRLFAYRFDALSNAAGLGGDEQITSTDLAGAPLLGLDIAPWINGVVFSALGEDGMGGFEAVVGRWTDADGNGAFDLSILFSTPGGTIEHLTVDGAGNAAWVLDTGDVDMLYAYAGGTLTPVDVRFGEIDELQMAGGHLVYRADSLANPGEAALFDYAYAALSPVPIEVPTDEDTGGIPGSGWAGGLFDRAISEGFVFEALVNNGAERRLFVTNGSEVFDALRGGTRHSEGAVLDGHWVGTGQRGDTGEFGLFQVQADGSLTTLYAAAAPLSLEAEVLGRQVLFGTRDAAGNDILVYDAVFGTTEVLLEDHLLGSASTIGSRIVFTARDETRAENSDADPTNDVWSLYAFDGMEAQFYSDLFSPFGQDPIQGWHGGTADFVGGGSRAFWKQAHFLPLPAPGEPIEASIASLDLDEPPGSALYFLHFANETGGNYDEATFADGRAYFQGSNAGGIDVPGGLAQMRVWTWDGVIPEGVLAAVTGAELRHPFGFPANLAAIGEEVFFLALREPTGRPSIFQVEDDGVTASPILHPGFLDTSGLVAGGSDLFFFGKSAPAEAAQIWRLSPGATPGEAGLPEALTNFAADAFMAGLRLGGDGNLYFVRFDDATGIEYWVVDVTAPGGARLLLDANRDVTPFGYAPQQVVFAPDLILV